MPLPNRSQRGRSIELVAKESLGLQGALSRLLRPMSSLPPGTSVLNPESFPGTDFLDLDTCVLVLHRHQRVLSQSESVGSTKTDIFQDLLCCLWRLKVSSPTVPM